MNSENRRDIYLPEGKWVNFFTGEHLEGACWLRDVYVPLEEMPVYVRANAVIPIYSEDVDCTDEMDLSKSMALRIDNDYKGFGIVHHRLHRLTQMIRGDKSYLC